MSKKDDRKFREAIWQYLIDHARPTNGMYHIHFYIRDQKQFFERVRARQRGYFTRYDLAEHEKLAEKHDKISKRLITGIQKKTREFEELQNHPKLTLRLLHRLIVYLKRVEKRWYKKYKTYDH